MKSTSSKLSSVTVLIVLSVFILSSNLYSQSVYGINDEIGGGSSGTAQVEKPDDSMLYIVGGTVIVGLIVYAIVSRSKEKNTEVDSSSTENTSIIETTSKLNVNNISIQKRADTELPVDLYFGMQKMNPVSNERRYLLGFRLAL